MPSWLLAAQQAGRGEPPGPQAGTPFSPSSQSASRCLVGLSPGFLLWSQTGAGMGLTNPNHIMQTHRGTFKWHAAPWCWQRFGGSDPQAGSASEVQAAGCPPSRSSCGMHRVMRSRASHLTSVLVLRWVRRDTHTRRHQWQEHAAHVHRPPETPKCHFSPQKAAFGASLPARVHWRRGAPAAAHAPARSRNQSQGRRDGEHSGSRDPGIGVTGSCCIGQPL